MSDVEIELFKLGVPVKTRHNEVAPSQYELAPIFENSNLATDHQNLMMQILRHDRRQVRPGLPAAREALRRHQRLGQAQQLVDVHRHRREPAQPRRQPRTTTPSSWSSVAAVIRAVSKYSRHPAPVASRRPHNDHRLGANEAPPAIISHLPGRPAQRHHRADRKGRRQEQQAGRHCSRPACRSCRQLPKEAGDRNRTSPFAFTGNKFEFRAVGASANIAGPNTILNTIVAESLDYIATKLEAAVKGGKDLNKAIQELLPKIIKEHKKVIFNGDGYTEEWHKEAEKRGLPNLKNTVDTLPVLHQEGDDRPADQVQGLHQARAGEPIQRSWPRTTPRR